MLIPCTNRVVLIYRMPGWETHALKAVETKDLTKAVIELMMSFVCVSLEANQQRNEEGCSKMIIYRETMGGWCGNPNVSFFLTR